MSDAVNPFEAMIAQAQEQAKEMTKVMAPAMESLTPKGFEALCPTMPKDTMEMWFGKTLNQNGLDAKTRLMLTLAGLTVLGAQAEAQIRMTVRHLLEAGATKQEIVECIGQMSMFGGIPAMTKALELAREVLDENEDKNA